MTRLFWVNARPYNKKVVTTALESGADAVIVPKGKSKGVRDLGLIKTVSSDGDLRLGQDVVEITISSQKDEAKALREPAERLLLIKTSDWKIIPLENLVAKRGKGLLAWVRSAEEAKIALEIMERGVDGIVLATSDLSEIKRTAAVVREQGERLRLIQATIRSVRPLGMGDRVCVDTITNMEPGQGMLVGNSSSGMFLVHAENVETPYCATRPFRVNAGAVHAYVRVPDGKTAYLADVSIGDPVLIIDRRGKSEVGFVGRAKVEKRPMMLVEATYKGKPLSLVMQNAETIRLTKPGGEPVSITHLKAGDRVLSYVEEAGRHFGVKIDETIVEK
ncbi:MAG: 3-dehydroquinate synthase II [Deltaproteobacteria bacterium]|jgi:3-dehydroquinate synthase II|nr:3-dehydroquinate synthase II [Deltaproteobacteria bacterium]